jgi:DNA-binding response OmpR family regulator
MQTPHILIVEDELVTRNTLKSIFEAEGYDVFEATDGAEMHQILSENDINLVIMDINLPGKNGLLLARELREQANVALMFLTGRDNEVDKILGLEIGADDYITKPFNPRELTIRARNLLSRTMNLGTQPQHINTMLYEAEVFARLVEDNEVNHPGLAVSRTTAKLQTEIRRQTGVVFPADGLSAEVPA